jgi:KDO2-lipid IV(A) lauroyltransferase
MFYLLLAIMYPVSLLPLWILYRVSDLGFAILYHLMGYRKDVVRDNMRQAFPEKSPAEIEAVMKRFYRGFCDQWIETLKLLSMSPGQLRRRTSCNWDELEKLRAEGRNGYILTGHIFNWEWANAAIALHAPQHYACVYLPLSSPGFDRLMRRIRTRTGARMISMKALKGGFKELQNGPYLLSLAADQNPSVVETAEWIPFMHREAPFFRGPDQMPRRAKAAVLIGGIRRVKRGHYAFTLTRIADDASDLDAGVILREYVRNLERQLEAQPDNYLWSHRRWKHKRKLD